jgi:hypothetical protein
VKSTSLAASARSKPIIENVARDLIEWLKAKGDGTLVLKLTNVDVLGANLVQAPSKWTETHHKKFIGYEYRRHMPHIL